MQTVALGHATPERMLSLAGTPGSGNEVAGPRAVEEQPHGSAATARISASQANRRDAMRRDFPARPPPCQSRTGLNSSLTGHHGPDSGSKLAAMSGVPIRDATQADL